MEDINSKSKTASSAETEGFVFVQEKEKLADVKIETKKIGYFHDALSRFSQNKGSIVAGAILVILVLFSIIVPMVSGYGVNETDDYYIQCLPKNPAFAGTGFWDGAKEDVIGETYFVEYSSYGRATLIEKTTSDALGTSIVQYRVRIDTYEVGCKYKYLTAADYQKLKDYDDGLPADAKLFQPMVDTTTWNADWNESLREAVRTRMQSDANLTYQIKTQAGVPLYDSNGNLQYCWQHDANGNYVYFNMDSGVYKVRINWARYYYYLHGHEPMFLLGSDTSGRDIMTRLASGGRLSLALGVIVSFFNILIGIVYGAIEGYYGGATDIVMERISEILSEVPFMIVVSLFQIYLVSQRNINPVISLFVAFVAVDWIGTAATVRMQFYRYKNQDYVLAARTLGAKDSRLIFRHIFPNAVGPVITSSVLMIPGVIFSESSLSYLGIINFSAAGITSIGAMLAEGQRVYTSYPNVILWPAIYISLLMICFNIFGNGLRDAFNPQLRGAGEQS